MIAHADMVLIFLATWAGLTTAHHVADYWVQTDWMATHKHLRTGEGAHRHEGMYACGLHAVSVWITGWVVLTPLACLLGQAAPFLAALTLNAVTHYWADRRYTLRWLAGKLGKLDYYDSEGAHLLDQAFHKAWIFLSALLAAVL